MKRICSVVHMDAGQDSNGNPRRCFVLVHPIHGPLAACDEGYLGLAAWESDPDWRRVQSYRPTTGHGPFQRHVGVALRVRCLVSEYHETLREYGPKGKGRRFP